MTLFQIGSTGTSFSCWIVKSIFLGTWFAAALRRDSCYRWLKYPSWFWPWHQNGHLGRVHFESMLASCGCLKLPTVNRTFLGLFGYASIPLSPIWNPAFWRRQCNNHELSLICRRESLHHNGISLPCIFSWHLKKKQWKYLRSTIATTPISVYIYIYIIIYGFGHDLVLIRKYHGYSVVSRAAQREKRYEKYDHFVASAQSRSAQFFAFRCSTVAGPLVGETMS